MTFWSTALTIYAVIAPRPEGEEQVCEFRQFLYRAYTLPFDSSKHVNRRVVLERSQLIVCEFGGFKMFCVMLTRFEHAEGLSCSVTCLYRRSVASLCKVVARLGWNCHPRC